MKLILVKCCLFLILILTACSTTTNEANENVSVKVDYSMYEAEFESNLKKYIDDNFGIKGMETTWYKLFKEYQVTRTDKQTVITIIVPNTTTQDQGQSVISAVLSFVNDQTQTKYKADKITVKTEDGKNGMEKDNPLSK